MITLEKQEHPWRAEPNAHDWLATNGVRCAIRRHPVMLTLNGYVMIPDGHPWHGRGWDDLGVDAHHGLTYAGVGLGTPLGDGRLDGPPGRWWFGFDTMHAWDVVPFLLERTPDMYLSIWDMPGLPRTVYRDLGYVTDVCNRVAAQITAVTESY